MQTRVIFLAVLSLLVLGTSDLNSAPRVIFSVEAAEVAGIPPPLLRDWKPLWSPTAKDVASLESQLPGFLQAVQPEIARNLSDYGIQFFGITIPDRGPGQPSKPVIHFNAFCKSVWSDSDRDYWREVYVWVLGGGACFFEGIFDPEAKRVSGFSINELR